MPKGELPPIEYDRGVERYGFFDPRAFWEKVAGKEPAPKQPPVEKQHDGKEG